MSYYSDLQSLSEISDPENLESIDHPMINEQDLVVEEYNAQSEESKVSHEEHKDPFISINTSDLSDDSQPDSIRLHRRRMMGDRINQEVANIQDEVIEEIDPDQSNEQRENTNSSPRYDPVNPFI